MEKNLIENKDEIWSDLKRTAKDIDNYQLIDEDIDKIELNKSIRSFNFTNHLIKLKFQGNFCLIGR